MNADVFRAAATNGLGRAVIALQNGPWRPHADAIAHVCRHNPAYDPQCEGDRAAYVYGLIQMTDDASHFAGIVEEALETAEGHWDLAHLFGLARRFAADGSEAVRRAMFERFVRDDASQCFHGAEEIVLLDGVPGLLHSLDHIGRRLMVDPQLAPSDDFLLTFAQDEVDPNARAAAFTASKTNPNIRRYLDAVQASVRQKEVRTAQRTDWHHLSYPQLREWMTVQPGKVPRGRLTNWGRQADSESLARAAADLLLEQDSRRLADYLRLFHRRAFPLGPQRLIELAQSNEPELATAALRALQQMTAPEVRQLAIDRLQQTSVDGDELKLLALNYQPGDHLLVEQCLSRADTEEVFHGVAHATVHIFETQRTADGLNALLQIYERVRCSICRLAAVEILGKERIAPTWMVAECRHDSYESTREWAAGYNSSD